MEKESCLYKEAKTQLGVVKLFSCLSIIIGLIMIYLLISIGVKPKNCNFITQLLEDILKVLTYLYAGFYFFRSAYKLEKELINITNYVFQCKASIKILSPFFIGSGITVFVFSITDETIDILRLIIVCITLIIIGFAIYFFAKHFLKKHTHLYTKIQK